MIIMAKTPKKENVTESNITNESISIKSCYFVPGKNFCYLSFTQ